MQRWRALSSPPPPHPFSCRQKAGPDPSLDTELLCSAPSQSPVSSPHCGEGNPATAPVPAGKQKQQNFWSKACGWNGATVYPRGLRRSSGERAGRVDTSWGLQHHLPSLGGLGRSMSRDQLPLLLRITTTIIIQQHFPLIHFLFLTQGSSFAISLSHSRYF